MGLVLHPNSTKRTMLVGTCAVIPHAEVQLFLVLLFLAFLWCFETKVKPPLVQQGYNGVLYVDTLNNKSSIKRNPYKLQVVTRPNANKMKNVCADLSPGPNPPVPPFPISSGS